MELEIYSPSQDGFVKEIKWNHEQIKAEVAEKVSYYAGLVYTEDQIKEAKADRAKLNKFVQALEAKRKEMKTLCLAPYDDFERKLKEITSIVNEPIMMIDKQVKNYEEQKREEKLEAIKEYFSACEKPFELTLEKIFDKKWLNATVSMKAVCSAIDSILEGMKKDLDTLANLPEFAFEATEVYKTTLDVNKAINEGHRLSEIQRRKQAYEAEQKRRKEEAEAFKRAEFNATQKAVAVQETMPETEKKEAGNVLPEEVMEKPEQPVKEWVGFRALLSVEDAKALAGLFTVRQIEYAQMEL